MIPCWSGAGPGSGVMRRGGNCDLPSSLPHPVLHGIEEELQVRERDLDVCLVEGQLAGLDDRKLGASTAVRRIDPDAHHRVDARAAEAIDDAARRPVVAAPTCVRD